MHGELWKLIADLTEAAAVAARLFLPPDRCGMIIDRGEDFPEAFEKELNAYGEGMIWFRPRAGKTTRAINIYSGGQIGCVRRPNVS